MAKKQGNLAAYQKNFGNKGNRMMKQGLPNKAPGTADAMTKQVASGADYSGRRRGKGCM